MKSQTTQCTHLSLFNGIPKPVSSCLDPFPIRHLPLEARIQSQHSLAAISFPQIGSITSVLTCTTISVFPLERILQCLSFKMASQSGLEPFPPLNVAHNFVNNHKNASGDNRRRRKSSGLGGDLPGDSDVAAFATLSHQSPSMTPGTPVHIPILLSLHTLSSSSC
jgi:hypothetical protein